MSQREWQIGNTKRLYIYLFTHVYTGMSLFPSWLYQLPDINYRRPATPRHSCPSHSLAPPTPSFPSSPSQRRQRDRVATAWLQLQAWPILQYKKTGRPTLVSSQSTISLHWCSSISSGCRISLMSWAYKTWIKLVQQYSRYASVQCECHLLSLGGI